MSAQATYSYRVRDSSGQVVTGTMVAASPDEIAERLRADGKFVCSVEDRPLRATTLDREQVRRNQSARRVRRDDVIAFCQQLSVMLETGVPLAEALDAFCKQPRRREFGVVLGVLRDDICSGENFSVAMAKWPRVFPDIMIGLMKAAEASGTMGMMLGRVGAYLGKERRTAKQIRGALGYPLFMMGTGLVMTVLLMAFVLPRFASIYASRSASLPLPTRILMAVSDFVTSQYMIYGPALGLTILGLVLILHTRGGRRAADWLRLHLPVLRAMYGQLYITRAARTMATLLGAGVNLLDIIDICRGVTRNAYYSDLWDRMEHDIRNGKQLSDAFFASPFISTNVSSMIASGETSGRLGEVMEKIAEFAEQELDAAVKQVTGYIEPVMIVAMGAVIGTVAIALLLPIFSMGRVMAGG